VPVVFFSANAAADVIYELGTIIGMDISAFILLIYLAAAAAGSGISTQFVYALPAVIAATAALFCRRGN